MERVNGAVEDGSPAHPAERERDVQTRVRLAYRLQHLKTVYANREMREQWRVRQAAAAREHYVEQREAARAQNERERDEQAQQRLRAFWARQGAGRQHTDQGETDGQAAR